MGGLVEEVINSIVSIPVLTSKGPVEIEGPVGEAYLHSLKMDKQLKNFRPADRQREALMEIANLNHGRVYIARHQNTIVGYTTLHRPSQYARWYRHPRVLELGCIEVSPSWRGCGLGKTLLAAAFSQPFIENFIIITTEYYWHWDIEASGLNVRSYQKMLTNLFGSVGFERRYTDDPEIMAHPANVLMVRFGSRVGREDLIAFKRLLFETMF